MSNIHVVGRACRLPGAPSVAQLWANLDRGQCSIGRIGADRWELERYYDPRPGTPGKYYTLSAGTLSGLWRFDPKVFAISPREAVQMDPQQRLCLEVALEAIEDAGLPPSLLAGREIGVYAGASSLDYGTTRMFDAASADAYFMIGNTLSLVSNRVSHAFDLTGPSLTIDTACSSSLVALHHAVEAIASSRIEAAIVLGVNVLASPFSFIGFSQAQMLSPDGLCRPFDSAGNGYVRAEGAVALLIMRDGAEFPARRPYCRIVATGINADGHTTGVSLPSAEKQAQLLEGVYGSSGVDPADVAFVEAHGTGTRVGDPAEATALGRALAQRRSEPLAIGSIKSNIGHLEPASGLAGVLKAMLALEHDRLPQSLHFVTPNPDIAFEELNLQVAAEPVPLARSETPRYAGINSFGFGGTNAHVIIADPAPREKRNGHPILFPGASATRARTVSPMVVLSAACGPALADLAQRHLDSLRVDPAIGIVELAAAIGHTRELRPERAALLATSRVDLEAELEALAASRDTPAVVRGRATVRHGKTVLVFSGNGSQWAGMGRAALAGNSAFRAKFAQVDEVFSRLADWSLAETIVAADLAEQLKSTLVAQPLLLALQIATTAALADCGIEADIALGHSVGEVAAAYAAGAITLGSAVEIIVARSLCQEPVRNLGSMATVRLGEKDAAERIAACGRGGLEIAAVNSPHSVTISGPTLAVRNFCAAVEGDGIATRHLDLEYPFHCALIDPARPLLLDALQGLETGATSRPFVSTVTGGELSGTEINAHYWWQNVRRPVRFAEAVASAERLGGQVFIEIGPRPVLQTYLRECLAVAGGGRTAMASLSPGDSAVADPIRRTAAEAIVHGARFDKDTVFGPRPAEPVELPSYPWQRTEFRGSSSPEAIAEFTAPRRPHPLLGWPVGPDGTCWRAHIDPVLLPWVADHRVDGQAVYPGTAFLETALAAARSWLGTDAVVIRDMEILHAMIFREGETREVRVQISPESGTIELASRPRLNMQDFEVHAVCRATRSAAPSTDADDDNVPATWDGALSAADVYAAAARHGNDYGPAFRRVERALISKAGEITVALDGGGCAEAFSDFGLDPRVLDAAFHGLFVRPGAMPGDGTAPLPLLPVRCGELIALRPGRPIRLARIAIRRRGQASLQADIRLFDAEGAPVALMRDVRFAMTALLPRLSTADVAYHEVLEPIAEAAAAQVPGPTVDELASAAELAASSAVPASPEPRLLLEAAARRLAYDEFAREAGPDGKLQPDAAVPNGSPDFLRLQALLLALEASQLATSGPDGWSLAAECALPEADVLIRTVLAEHPAWVADCVLLQSAARKAAPSAAMLDHFLAASPRRALGFRTMARLAAERLTGTAGHGPRRIAVIGAGGPLPRQVADLAGEQDRIILYGTDQRSLDRARIAFAGDRRVEVLNLSKLENLANAGPFDLALSAFGLSEAGTSALAALARALGRNGALVSVEATPDAFHAAVFGREPQWYERLRLRSGAEWAAELERAGFAGPRAVTCDDDATILVALPAPPQAAAIANGAAHHEAAALPIILVCDGNSCDRPIAEGLVTGLAHHGRDVTWLRTRAETKGPDLTELGHTAHHGNGNGNGNGNGHTGASNGADHSGHEANGHGNGNGNGNGHSNGHSSAALPPSEIVFVAGAADPKAGACAATLEKRCSSLSRLLATGGTSVRRLWVVLPGESGHNTSIAPDGAMESALWAFVRTAANELPDIDLRLVTLAADSTCQGVIGRLAALIADAGPDREIVVGPDVTSAVRIRRGLRKPARPSDASADGERSVLAHGQRRALQSLTWQRRPIAAPGPGQVVIDVAATGLNFRDVMWALGLLPEEALEDGFAGPTLGFECAGRIAAAGEGVTGLAPGDPVIAMAPQAFASHVTVDAKAVARLPDSIPLEAAATIPVAYLTAHYALDHLARLQEGEWVLIHGAAGGVGLAAVEIVRAKGARIVATAGSEEKRELLKLLGAEHVLSSRSLAFADEVRHLTGGVDVVLNSLSGEAMEASLGLMKPFGRFLELGKRDFYANSRLGLRPFRRNVSYFGIDADQLLAQQGELAARLMAELMAKFADGIYRPLPYRAFAASEVEDAFRLMQQSGHIGKIVVTPPKPERLAPARTAAGFHAAPDGAHVVFGGLAGFGLRTAVWLADHGARAIVLAGRSGRVGEPEQAIVADLRARGVEVTVAACGVTDRAAVDGLLARIRETLPIRGIVHAAAVLDDARIEDLDEEKLSRVLAPKVTGAALLDELTRSDSLDYFLLYSSVTTLVGNPGQGAYVAANGYLEGLARRRRAEGQPALAVRWGAISDAGMLQRDSKTAAALARRAGATGFTARQALDLLAAAMLDDDGSPAAAVVTLAPMNWAEARQGLALLGTPLFADLATAMSETVGASERIDLAAAIAGLDGGAAADLIAGHLAAELAHILRMPAGSINLDRPLPELGLDSLMAVELRLAASRKLGVEIPLAALADGLSVKGIAEKAASALKSPARTKEPLSLEQDLAKMHVAEALDSAEIERFARQIERHEARASR